MAEQILLSHADPAQAGSMVSLLSDVGFEISTVADVSAVDAQIRSFPALLLLDAELARKDQGNLAELSQRLQLTEVPCLLFSSNGTSPAECLELQPASFGIIRDPSDRRELLTLVSHALEVHRLRRWLRFWMPSAAGCRCMTTCRCWASSMLLPRSAMGWEL